MMPDAYQEKPQTARTRHKCCECLKDIEPGERYVRIGGVWDGRGQTYKHCLECHDIFGMANRLATLEEYDNEYRPSFCQLYQWLIDAEVIQYGNMTEEEYNDLKTRLRILKEQAGIALEREDDHRLVS